MLKTIVNYSDFKQKLIGGRKGQAQGIVEK